MISAKTISCLALLAIFTGHATALSTMQSAPSGAFSTGSLDDWQERSFVGNTDYQLVEGHGINVLQGHTQGQASILYREAEVDLLNTPILHWSWKVDRTYENSDEQTQQGDDFPARLYVVAQTGFLPWETLAINYVWASHTTQGESWSNPYTKKAKMIAIQSGSEHVGQWTSHSRDVSKDFEKMFGRNIDKLTGYAVMVDGDNTGAEATAWFGKIEFSSKYEPGR